MDKQINFQELANKLLPYCESIVIENSPGGKRRGNEYVSGDITGGQGDSFSFNLITGKWADFAANQKGHDVISYYAELKQINNAESAKYLTDRYLSSAPAKLNYPAKTPVKTSVIKPPHNAAMPQIRKNNQSPSMTWTYRDEQGNTLFYVARYDLPDGSKSFQPWTFTTAGKWENKAWPSPRPLYNLDLIAKFPDKPILITEGEKAADAVSDMATFCIPTTWPNGAQSVDKVDITPLYGRDIILWPDADEAGMTCMGHIAALLKEHCPSVKFINTDKSNGWDAADALKLGWQQSDLVNWAKPLITQLIKPEQAPVIQERVPEQAPRSQPRNKMALWLDLGLELVNGKNPMPICNAANASKLLNYAPKYANKIWFDEFHQAIMTTYNCQQSRKWTDADDLAVLYDLQSEWNMSKLSKSSAIDAIQTIAFNNRRNELKDWLLSLTWDGQHRITDFLVNAYGVEPSAYAFAVSRNWLVGLVARGISAGCKFDEMLILEGNQGTFKSTSLSILAGKYFAEAPSSIDNKDFDMALVGKWIVEFGELDQFRKAETTLIKKKLSQSVDNYRPSYGRHVLDIPRSCVFVGTTNKTEYLQDETGGRRFWPIWTNRADLEYIKENREQLFAEAVHEYRNGATWYEVPDEAKDHQENRRERDPWEEIIELNIADQDRLLIGQAYHNLSARLIAQEILNLDPKSYTQRESRRITKCMKVLGYEQVVAKNLGRTDRIYKKKV